MEALALQPSLDFELPAALQARRPPPRRDGVRLLVSRHHGQPCHARFVDLPSFLERGDLLVVNDSAAMPAALEARDARGAVLDLHLSTWRGADHWVVEPRTSHVRSGDVLRLPAGASARLIALQEGSRRLWHAALSLPLPLTHYLRRFGRPIRYAYAAGTATLRDFQTIFGRRPGSAEMPSAARPFTPAVVRQVLARGVGVAAITLHTGVSSLEGHETPYEEWFAVPAETAWQAAVTRRNGGRVVAVGTTVVRALESAWRGGRVHAAQGWTDLVVTPQRGVHAVDGLLTGFHEPRASHLAMLEAVAGRDTLSRGYAAALEAGYLWHEFGDVNLIL